MNFDDWPEFMTTRDVANALGVAPRTAQRILRRPGCPLVDPAKGRYLLINKHSLRDWLMNGIA